MTLCVLGEKKTDLFKTNQESKPNRSAKLTKPTLPHPTNTLILSVQGKSPVHRQRPKAKELPDGSDSLAPPIDNSFLTDQEPLVVRVRVLARRTGSLSAPRWNPGLLLFHLIGGTNCNHVKIKSHSLCVYAYKPRIPFV